MGRFFHRRDWSAQRIASLRGDHGIRDRPRLKPRLGPRVGEPTSSPSRYDLMWMVPRLIPDVGDDSIHRMLSHRRHAISLRPTQRLCATGNPFLPCDSSAPSLESLNDSRNQGAWIKPQQDVHVGGNNPALYQRRPFFDRNSGEVLTEEISDRSRDDRRPQPGGPDEMNKKAIVEHAPRSPMI